MPAPPGMTVSSRASIAPQATPSQSYLGWVPTGWIDEYSRTAQALEASLMRGETAPGSALEKLAAFLVAALESRRESGLMLPARSSEELTPGQAKRLRERDMMIRTRLKRLLIRGQHDGSVALRHVDSACTMILACLQLPVGSEGPAQQMWDGELVELLLAALAEPHAPEEAVHRHAAVVPGACACGAVRYEVDGPFDVVSHCHCPMCRNRPAPVSATFVAAPLARFRWLCGAEAVTSYRDGQNARAFCSRCGGLAPLIEPETGTVFCPAGTLERALGIRPDSHIFVPSRSERMSRAEPATA